VHKFSKDWFELADHRRRFFSRTVWVPIYGTQQPLKESTYGLEGHEEELLAVGAVLIDSDKRELAERLGWSEVGLPNTSHYVFDDGRYKLVQTFLYNDNEQLGEFLVLSQYVNQANERVVHINQDLIFALGLIEEDDKWLCANEGYEEVIRVERNDRGAISFVEIKAAFLRDYLAARNMALRLYTFRTRKATLEHEPNFEWPEHGELVNEPHDRCVVGVTKVNQDGEVPGARMMMKVWRTDVDEEDDVPEFGPESDSNTDYEKQIFEPKSTVSRYVVYGDHWRGEWIEPAGRSERVGQEEPAETLFVRADAAGEAVDLATLNDEDVGKYLWFKPEIITSLTSYRDSKFGWYTDDTGFVFPSPDGHIHFGMNSIGLVNAYAYDIASADRWVQRLWIAHNVTPDGKVSAELLEAQMRATPARTRSHEDLLDLAMRNLDFVFSQWAGAPVYRRHIKHSEIVSKINRFTVSEPTHLLRLAKEMVRITIEQLDRKVLRNKLNDAPENLGSLKLLERNLAIATDETYASKLLAPMYAINDLRQADAHLPKLELAKFFDLLGVNNDDPLVLQAKQMITSVVEALGIAGSDFSNFLQSQQSSDANKLE
jgi:hypothetical protein